MIPTATPLPYTGDEAVAFAAAVTQHRDALRSAEQEAKTIRHCMTQEPPHLTLGEHARYTVEIHAPGRETLLRLQKLRGLLVEPRGRTYRHLLGLNLSHVRQLTDHYMGDALAGLLRPLAPATLGDLPHRDCALGLRLVPDDELTPDERRLFPSRSFLIRCSRATSHQIVRHRALDPDGDYDPETASAFEHHAAFEERSLRLKQREGETFDYFWSPAILADPARLQFAEWAASEAEKSYHDARERGWRAEEARELLPLAVGTTLIVTAPMAGWRDFLTKRAERKAQAPIRWLALLIRDHLAETCPEAVDGIDVDTAGLQPYLERREANDAAD